MQNIDPTLVLFCKRPSLGVGKQRLAADTDQTTAFKVATALHSCAMEDFNSWDGRKILSPASQEDVDWARQHATESVEILSQPAGDNLGIRIQSIDLDARKSGHHQPIFIGSDCPSLNTTLLHKVAEQLQTHDVVLGPARDGGVYLMASRSPWPELADLPWSTEQLRDELVMLCQQNNLSVGFLAELSDVDRWQDLLDARIILQNAPSPARIHLLQLIETIEQSNGPH